MKYRYFAGEAADLGHVHRLPFDSFAALSEYIVTNPTRLRCTRDEYLALTPDERDHAKRTRYLVPACFKSSPSPRKAVYATYCNLLFLDIDDHVKARGLLTQGWNLLAGRDLLVWHTASSTEAKPRLRIMVGADEVPIKHYKEAVIELASMLGVPPTRESLVPVQPMYLPVTFRAAGEEEI